MKKVLALILALVLTMGLAACAAKPAEEPKAPETTTEVPVETPKEEPAPEVNKIIAGVVFQEDQFMKLLSAGYAAAAEDRGYEIQLANTNNDQTKETEVLSTYVSQGLAGVAISPLNTQVSPVAIEEANKAGLKIALSNCAMEAMPFAVGSYSADNVAFCRQTGDMAAAFIKENYAADAVIKVGIVQFKTQVPEQSADRVKGFLEGLDAAGIKYEIVSDQDAWLQDMAVAKVGDMISANPDIDIIFAANEGGTVGTTMAVDNAGNAGKTYVFGSDSSEQIVGLLKDENNILQAVTGQDPFAIGYATVTALCDSLEGKSFDGEGKLNIVAGIPLTRSDIAGLDTFLTDLQSKM